MGKIDKKYTYRNRFKPFSGAFLMTCMVLVASFLCVNLVSAWSTTTFNNSEVSENLTYTGSDDITRYLKVPEDTFLIYGYINLSGFKALYNYYLEDNSSDYDINSSLWNNPQYVDDDDIVTAGNCNAGSRCTSTYRWNKFDGITYNDSTKLNIKRNTDGCVPGNYVTSNISQTCLNYNSDYIEINVTLINDATAGCTLADKMYIFCRNSTGLELIFNDSSYGHSIYEIDFRWYGNESSPVNPYIDINGSRVWNYTGGFNITENKTSNLRVAINNFLDLAELISGYYYVPFMFHSDSAGYLQYSGMNFSDVGFLENSQTYNSVTTEGATESFTLNFTISPSLQVSTVELNYNDTQYSIPYRERGDDIVAQGTITIPKLFQSTNLSFYWNITLSNNEHYTTSKTNQSIRNLNIGNCTTYNYLIYNFTNYDETTQGLLGNNTFDIQFSLYNLGRSLLLINFSQRFEDLNPVKICSEISFFNSVNYSLDVIVRYSSNETNNNVSYAVEYYNILNETLSNNTIPQHIDLYDLKSSESTKFRLTFRDSYYNLAPNVLVKVYRKYVNDGEFKIVEIPLTDSNGQTILNLVKNDVVYNLVMVDLGGQVIATFNSIKFFCQDFTIGECTVNLNSEPDIDDLYNRDEDFGISITDPSYSNTTSLVSISFITDDLLPKTVRMSIFRNNAFGNRSVCSNSLTSASGTLTCNVSSITDTDQYLFIEIFVDDDLYSRYTINLNATTLRFGTVNGSFYAFLLILFLICFFMDDRRALLISLLLGWIVVIGLGLMNGKFIGIGSAGIWMIVTISILLWKLNKEES